MNAKLKFPILGLIKIRLIEKRDFKWLAELIEADLNIEVYEDDFEYELTPQPQSNGMSITAYEPAKKLTARGFE